MIFIYEFYTNLAIFSNFSFGHDCLPFVEDFKFAFTKSDGRSCCRTQSITADFTRDSDYIIFTDTDYDFWHHSRDISLGIEEKPKTRNCLHRHKHSLVVCPYDYRGWKYVVKCSIIRLTPRWSQSDFALGKIFWLSFGSLGRTVRRIITFLVVVVVTAVAVYAFWFWALRPLGFASYLSSTTATDADIIRQYWPHRLVQPEWVSSAPDRLLNWSFAEAVVRSSVVGIFWLITTGTFIYGYMRHRKVRPNTALEPTPTAP